MSLSLALLLAFSAVLTPNPRAIVSTASGAGFAGILAQGPDPATVDKGRQLFEKNKCLLCHKLEGKGGALSVALDGVADRRDAAALRRVLTDPEATLKDSTAKVKMPKFPLTEEELEALVAYLGTLKSR